VQKIKEGISISKMMELINSGATVDVIAVTLDFKRQTGGKRIQVRRAVRGGSNHSTKDNGTITFLEEGKYAHPITVHTALIETINGLTVL